MYYVFQGGGSDVYECFPSPLYMMTLRNLIYIPAIFSELATSRTLPHYIAAPLKAFMHAYLEKSNKFSLICS